MRQASSELSLALHSVTLQQSELCKNCPCDSQMRSVFQKGRATKAVESERHFFPVKLLPLMISLIHPFSWALLAY